MKKNETERATGLLKAATWVPSLYFAEGIPYVIVGAHVCRPAWLIEMECMAVKEMDNKEFAKL